jgi:hypothetical protein
MDKMPESGINMRKQIAMGEHERMYSAGKGGYGKPTKKGGSGKPKPPKPVKMDAAAEPYTERLY